MTSPTDVIELPSFVDTLLNFAKSQRGTCVYCDSAVSSISDRESGAFYLHYAVVERWLEASGGSLVDGVADAD